MSKKIIGFLLILIFTISALFSGCSSSGTDGDYADKSLKDFKGKTIITFFSQSFSPYIETAIEDPEILLVENTEDAILNLMQGKADAIATSMANYTFYSSLLENVTYINEPLGRVETPVIFANNPNTEGLVQDFNAYIKNIWDDGTQEEIAGYWFDGSEKKKSVDFSDLDENAPPLRIAYEELDAPFAYSSEDSTPLGYEVDLLVRFCKEYGYYPQFVPGNKTGIITDAQNGIVDVCLADYTAMTDSESKLAFSDPILYDDIILVVSTRKTSEKLSVRVTDSFNKTILDEDRYLIYISGLIVTLEITFPSILFGIALGFILYYLRVLNKKPLLFLIDCLCLLKERVPDLVLLMIFYYVIFQSARINAVVIAILAFTYMFAITTYRNLYDTASKVSDSQYLAAKSLGYNGYETFRFIIFPQILPELLDRFKGEFVTHMLETSIVGLLAVTDLTGAANYIRSITYHTFVPLLIVSVLYIVISSIIFLIIDLTARYLDPIRRRDRKFKQ